MDGKKKDLVRYSFKGPGYGRKSFAVYRDIKHGDGSREYASVNDVRVIAIDRAFKSGASSLDQCVVQIKEVIKSLYREDPRCQAEVHLHNAENWKVLDRFWEDEYTHRPLVSEYAARNELKNAIESLGELSIYSASREQIQRCIDARYKGNAQRRMVMRMRQLLKFIGRADEVRLRKNPKAYSKVSWLSERDFSKVLDRVETEIERVLLKLCYYSGLRIGEAYALEPHSLLPDGTVRVTEQLDREGTLRHTKTKKPRTAFLIPEGIEAFKAWTNASPEERATINRVEASRDLMKKYCKMAFPNEPSKHLTFHALRHCYAINLLSMGVSMSLVAQSLGNSLSVCQEHYAGFELTSDSIAAIHAIVSAHRSKK